MTTLKELTHESHEQAEAHPFTKLVLSKNISDVVYADYLYNQHAVYYTLESIATIRGLLDNLPGLPRASLIKKDFDELNVSGCKLYMSTHKYTHYVACNLTDSQILAHLYVRHMGDMYGGQMIKKCVPGSGCMYEFENRKELIETLRNKLDTSMASEANHCFDYAIQLFTELANEHNIQ
jgi:heme oxygenase